IAAVISSGWVCPSRVEPSTSANSSVTVPVGKSPLTPNSLQFTSGASTRGSISLMLASMPPPQAPKHQRKRVETPTCHADFPTSRPLGCPDEDPLAGLRKQSVSFGCYGDPNHCGGAWSAVAGCFLDELHARGQAEFGVDAGEVGLHGAR